jgi:hypothetical protein
LFEKLLSFYDSVNNIGVRKKSHLYKYLSGVNYQTYQRIKFELGEIVDFRSLNSKQKITLGLQLNINYYPLFYKYSAGELSNTCFLILTDFK